MFTTFADRRFPKNREFPDISLSTDLPYEEIDFALAQQLEQMYLPHSLRERFRLPTTLPTIANVVRHRQDRLLCNNAARCTVHFLESPSTIKIDGANLSTTLEITNPGTFYDNKKIANLSRVMIKDSAQGMQVVSAASECGRLVLSTSDPSWIFAKVENTALKQQIRLSQGLDVDEVHKLFESDKDGEYLRNNFITITGTRPEDRYRPSSEVYKYSPDTGMYSLKYKYTEFDGGIINVKVVEPDESQRRLTGPSGPKCISELDARMIANPFMISLYDEFLEECSFDEIAATQSHLPAITLINGIPSIGGDVIAQYANYLNTLFD